VLSTYARNDAPRWELKIVISRHQFDEGAAFATAHFVRSVDVA
jgi:hypothetical protein